MNAVSHRRGRQFSLSPVEGERAGVRRNFDQNCGSWKNYPLLIAAWERVLFFHFLFPPDLIRPEVPPDFDLDLYEGEACVSLIALTMRHFRPCRTLSIAGLCRLIRTQRFLNLRTYVRCDGEPGAFFFHGWLSQPFGLGLPSRALGLSYTFGLLDYQHDPKKGLLEGVVRERNSPEQFKYRAFIDPGINAEFCPPGSLAEFALERYTGFFSWKGSPFAFRAWHPPWKQVQISPTIRDHNLVTRRFPWFGEGRLVSAHFAPGFEDVWLGRVHRVQQGSGRLLPKPGSRSALFEMP
ncbi:MAG: hypothetical protein C5B50_24310 [Verrucomicrobia bacterium]|nr:MAG: hypothetical protein C5B50_24310 [Verrucomicrobiota bacterium]